MKLWYDYDEAAMATGLRPATLKKYCDQKRIKYIVRRFNAGWFHCRYRVIPASEILKIQAMQMTRKGEQLQWPSSHKS